MTSFPRQLQRWSRYHATLLVLAVIGTALGESMAPLLWTASVTFAALLALALARRTASARSLPNGITLLRLACILGLAWTATATEVTGYWLALAGLILLLGDALDGWVARRCQSMTRVGALFDEEVDAFFLLVLCAVTYHTGRLGWWILLPGLLRYAFVLLRPLLESKTSSTELRSRRGRVIFVVMMIAMLTTFLPWPRLYLPAVIGASGLLLISFAADTYALMRKNRRLPLAAQQKVSEESQEVGRSERRNVS